MKNQGRRSFWGWGDEGKGVDAALRDNLKGLLGMRLGASAFAEILPPRLDDLRLPSPRWSPPSSLADLVSQDTRERAAHTYGKSFRDIVRGLAGDFSPAPDAVAFPKSEADVARILDYCGEH